MDKDVELLRQFAAEGSEAAFSELVRQRIDFVYGVALRHVGGDAHLAADAVQEVFLDLARKARELSRRPVLVNWLYTGARFAATNVVRRQARWLNREREALTMHKILAPQGAAEPEWETLRPVLDDAMQDLNERDRTAILLRFFEHRRVAEIGARLGLAEHAAGRRIERALEKLRGHLARRGITSTATALGAALAAQPVGAAPAGLAAAVTGTSVSAAAAGLGVGTTIHFLMSMTKLKVGAVCALVALGAGAYFATQRQFESIRTTDDVVLQTRMKQIAYLEGEVQRLKDVNRKLAAAQGAPGRPDQAEAAAAIGGSGSAGQASLDMLHAFTDLIDRGLLPQNLLERMPFMTPDGKLTPIFTELFAVNPIEREALQRAVDDTRKQLSDLGLANATTQRKDDGSLVIDIQPFAGGREIHDRLVDSVQQTLGAERGAAFLMLVDGQIQNTLAEFGVAHQTLTLTHKPPTATNQSGYKLQDARAWKDAKGNHNNSDGDPIPDLNTLSDRYGSIARLVPPDF